MTQAGLFDRPRAAAPADPYHGSRWYQREACEAIIQGFEEVRSQLLVLATGLGKTFCFSTIARNWAGNVLVLAHREELLEQAKASLERMTGETVEIEQADRRASRRTRIVVASLDTMRTQARKDRFGKDHFGLVINDECFPAGTLVDGTPIERIAEGDVVTCVDHVTGLLERRPVVRRFSKLAKDLVVLYHGATSLTCTGNHPIYVKRGESVGYVQASRVEAGDLLCVWRDLREVAGDLSADRGDLFPFVSLSDLKSDDGSDEPPLRIKANDGQQSHAQPRGAGEDVIDASGHEAYSVDSTGKRAWADRGGDSYRDGSGVADERGGSHGDATGLWVSSGLQTGCGQRVSEDWHRGGWAEPLGVRAPIAGCEERKVLTWTRVDRVACHQPASAGGTRVYNLEVEGCHTYLAENVLVHNCHHCLAPSYRETLEWFDAKLLGVTATPDRGDEKALGQVFDQVSYVFDILQGIEAGYLVPLRGHQVELGEIQLDGLAKVAGDLAKGQLDEVMVRAVEGIVHKTIELAPGRQGIGFLPGVKSAQYAAERMNALVPGSSIFISGETPRDERRAMSDAFKKGQYRYLFNCQVATEGYDAPACSLIIQGSPTLSRARYVQMVGRATRVLPGCVEHIEGREGGPARRDAIAASAKPDALILDFVGNATKHALISPEDLLGGDYTPAEIEEAKRKAKKEGGENPLKLLENARKELAAVAAAVRSKVQATHRSFDPFQVLDMDLTSTTRDDLRWGRQPPTEKQLEALKNMKVPEAARKAMSQREASKLLTERNQRFAAGLASYAQLAHLSKFGVTSKDVTFKAAGAALTYVATQGWNPKRVDIAKLTELATGKL